MDKEAAESRRKTLFDKIQFHQPYGHVGEGDIAAAKPGLATAFGQIKPRDYQQEMVTALTKLASTDNPTYRLLWERLPEAAR